METAEKIREEHGDHFNDSIVNEVILEDMKKNPSQLQPGFLHPAYQGTIAEAPGRKSGDRD